jgi:hypothetical protein
MEQNHPMDQIQLFNFIYDTDRHLTKVVYRGREAVVAAELGRLLGYTNNGSRLVVQHSGCDGYNRLSLRRALAIVKRQLTVAWTALRWVSQAVVVRRTRSWVGSRWSRPCLDTTANSISAILSQLPCLGV